MHTHTQPADQVVLHVAGDQIATTQPMHEALLRTGRTVLTRCDLYQAMGALAGFKRATPIEAIFISAAIVAHDDGEFFDIVPRSFPELAIYVYGESVGSADQIIVQSTATHIDPETVGSLFDDPDREPSREPDRTLPQADSSGEASIPITEIAAEPSPIALAADAPSAVEQRLLRSLDEEDTLRHSASANVASVSSSDPPPDPPSDLPAEQHASDQSHVAEVGRHRMTLSDASPTKSDDHEPRPPVPWNPSLARPARKPPNQGSVLEVVDDDDDDQGQTPDDYASRTDESDADQPLLTREELDALLREGHDSTGGLEHRI